MKTPKPEIRHIFFGGLVIIAIAVAVLWLTGMITEHMARGILDIIFSIGMIGLGTLIIVRSR